MKGGSWFSNQLPLIQFTKHFPKGRYAYDLLIKEKPAEKITHEI